jgi:hypothetical protein
MLKRFLLLGAITLMAAACATNVDESESPAPAVQSDTVEPNAEYLYPGVYVEEVSFRANPIPGVSTTPTARTVPLYAFDAGH